MTGATGVDAGTVIRLDWTETIARLPFSGLVPQIHRAAAELRLGRIQSPPRVIVPMGAAHGALMCMPAVSTDLTAVKLLTVLPNNSDAGLPMVQGLVSVFDAADGRPLAQLDAEALTSRRTAAVSLAGAERLSNGPPRTVLIVGSGVQAASHIEAFASYFGTPNFIVAARTRNSAEHMRARILATRPDLRIKLIALNDLSSFAWDDVNAVVCATAARSPVLPDNVPPHVLVIAVGAYRPDMIELPARLIHQRSVAVDTIESAQHEAGDLIHADIDWADVVELGAIEGAPGCGGWLFKSVGHAAWDLAACRTILATSSDF